MSRAHLGACRWAGWLAIAVALASSGCNAGSKPEATAGTLRGTVTFEGSPISEGEISFVHEETGGGATAQIDASGRFEVDTPLQVGKYRVAVCPPTLRIAPGEPGAEVPLQRMKQYPHIPEFYHSEYSSNLTVTIETGENSVVVNMKRQTKPKDRKKSKTPKSPAAKGFDRSDEAPASKAVKTKPADVDRR